MLKYDTKSGHTSLLRRRSGGAPSNTNNAKTDSKQTDSKHTDSKHTDSKHTDSEPTVNIPTVKTQKNNLREKQKTDKKDTPLVRHSRKRGGGWSSYKDNSGNVFSFLCCLSRNPPEGPARR